MYPICDPRHRRLESPRPRRGPIYVPGACAVILLLLALRAGAQDGVLPATSDPAPERVGIPESGRARSAVSDTLPFAKHPTPKRLPTLGLGFGFAFNCADYSSLERGLTKMEDWYRAQGWTITPHGRVHLNPMSLWLVTIRVHPQLDLAAQFGGKWGGERYLRQSDLQLIRRFRSSAKGAGGFFVGLGAGQYAFSWKQKYENRVSESDSGSWDVLDSIRLTRTASYATAMGGFTIEPSPSQRFEVYAQYLQMKPIQARTNHVGTFRVDLSAAQIGARFAVFF